MGPKTFFVCKKKHTFLWSKDFIQFRILFYLISIVYIYMEILSETFSPIIEWKYPIPRREIFQLLKMVENLKKIFWVWQTFQEFYTKFCRMKSLHFVSITYYAVMQRVQNLTMSIVFLQVQSPLLHVNEILYVRYEIWNYRVATLLKITTWTI